MSHLFIGLEGLAVNTAESQWLARADVGGVVLFARNFQSASQLQALNREIHRLCPGAIICVDQEGGRVQRFLDPCTELPSLASLGRIYDQNNDQGLELSFRHGWLMASEMLALGCDLSFAPVLDLDRGSVVIGNRAFHQSIEAVMALAGAYIKGMHDAGMIATGKHYPGHGSVAADTHHDFAVDERPYGAIAKADLKAFAGAIEQGLDAVMMAHVIYPGICPKAAGYSRIWCQDILRQRSGFEGVIFSDDLGMRAAMEVGDFSARAQTAMDAGCDVCLICRPEDVAEAMVQIEPTVRTTSARNGSDFRDRLRGQAQFFWDDFARSREREQAQTMLRNLED